MYEAQPVIELNSTWTVHVLKLGCWFSFRDMVFHMRFLISDVAIFIIIFVVGFRVNLHFLYVEFFRLQMMTRMKMMSMILNMQIMLSCKTQNLSPIQNCPGLSLFLLWIVFITKRQRDKKLVHIFLWFIWIPWAKKFNGPVCCRYSLNEWLNCNR